VTALRATPGLVDRLRGRPSQALSDSAAGDAAPVITVRHLSFTYPGGHTALHDVSFDLRRQDFLAIVGANGAGKTTLGSLLSGVLVPPPETVFVEGADASDLRAWAIAEKVGHVFQNPEHQFVSNTVRGELAFSLSPRDRGGSRHLTPEQERSVDDWLERLGLLRLAEANPFTLSQGQKRRLSVAAMLIRGCPALILDEPTLGQDAVQSGRLMEMMREFQAGGGTVAMITHDMRLVAEYAGSLLVLAGGRPVYLGGPAGFFAQPDLVEAASLAIPAVAQVGLGLQEAEGFRGGLLIARAFLDAAGRADAQGTDWAGS